MAKSLPSTVTTEERFPGKTKPADIEAKVDLNVAAGAVTCSASRDPETKEWIVTTVWNVIGGNG